MKELTLIIARHGKAESGIDSKSDFERNLKEKGIEQSVIVGKGLEKEINSVDLVISSSANRARKTAEILAKELSYSKKNIQFESSLYESGIEEILTVVKNIKSSSAKVLLVGHNPAWSDLVNLLQSSSFVGLRTSDVAILKFEIPKWELIHPMSGELVYIGRFEEDNSK